MSYHIPVLIHEVSFFAEKYLDKNSDILIVDGTLGDAGHSLALLKIFPKARLLGIDRDAQMLERARSRLEGETNFRIQVKNISIEEWEQCLIEKDVEDNIKKKERSGFTLFEPGVKIVLAHTSYKNLPSIMKYQNIKADFLLLDLGTSMFQLKMAERGFSFKDLSLDMRFDTTSGPSTEELVNFYSEKELEKILKEYGEEVFSKRIAREIVQKRPFKSAQELSNCIMRVKGNFNKDRRIKSIHPATQTFQALRIATNSELENLSALLKELPYILNKGGVAEIISFHSLEDRIVKNTFRDIGTKINKKNTNAAKFVIVTPKPLRPSEEEVKRNPASRSALLRVLYAQRGT